MNIKNFSFFILDGEILIKNGPVSITVDHSVMMSIVYFNHWESLRPNEKEFAIWYQNEVLVNGLLPGASFIVDSVLIEPYNQDKLCEKIMDIIIEPPLDDQNIF